MDKNYLELERDEILKKYYSKKEELKKLELEVKELKIEAQLKNLEVEVFNLKAKQGNEILEVYKKFDYLEKRVSALENTLTTIISNTKLDKD